MCTEIINHRFWLSDFEVYYKAAQRISASKNLYGYPEDDHYVFKYSPTSALLFIPFTIFKFEIAKYVYWLFLTFLICTAFYLSLKMVKPALLQAGNKKAINAIVFSATVTLALHFLRELHLGQVNYLLLFIYTFACYSFISGKWKLASTLLAISIFIKPFAILFIPYFVIKKKYKEVLVLVIAIVVCAILPLLFYRSVDMTISQYQLWFNELTIELSHKQSLLADANHTIFSVLARYTPLGFLLISAFIGKVYQLSILAILAILVYCFVSMKPKSDSSDQNGYFTAIDFALLVALIPLLAFTSENAFIYTQFLVIVVLCNFKKLRLYEKIMAVIGFLFVGGNFAELTGKKLSQALDNWSLVSVGTIILLCLLFVLRKRKLLDPGFQ